jgi:hypothetical protein
LIAETANTRLCRNIMIHLHGAGIVLNDELLPCMYVCIYVCVEMLIPRTCFSIGATTHLDVAGTTLHTTEHKERRCSLKVEMRMLQLPM